MKEILIGDPDIIIITQQVGMEQGHGIMRRDKAHLSDDQAVTTETMEVGLVINHRGMMGALENYRTRNEVRCMAGMMMKRKKMSRLRTIRLISVC